MCPHRVLTGFLLTGNAIFRLIQCSVSYNENFIWPIHSFQGDEICFDNRLAVKMTNLTTTYTNPVKGLILKSSDKNRARKSSYLSLIK